MEASKGSALFLAQFSSVSERNSWPRTRWWPWDPDGKWVGSPGPLPSSPWDRAWGREEAEARQRASKWLGTETILAETWRYVQGGSASNLGNTAFALGSATS